MGLYGLTSYACLQRKKEIGIRKALGAEAFDILVLINKKFILLVLLGLCLAAPLAYYTSGKWLDNFAYKMELSPLTLIFASFLVSLFALLTVSYQSFKAASTNPVKSLKE